MVFFSLEPFSHYRLDLCISIRMTPVTESHSLGFTELHGRGRGKGGSVEVSLLNQKKNVIKRGKQNRIPTNDIQP